MPDVTTRQGRALGTQDKIVKLGLITFNKAEVIGYGEEGKVYKGKFGEFTNAAIKDYVFTNSSTIARLKERAVKANESLRNVTCANIVGFFSFYEKPNAFYLCMELCDCNLEYFIRHWPQEIPKNGFEQTLNGLNVLHENQFLHRDLKPSNVLVKRERTRILLKVSDFSLSKEADAKMSVTSGPYVGTVGWMPPEIHHEVEAKSPNIVVNASADIFACGMLGYYVVSAGNMLYHSQQDINQDNADYRYLHNHTAEDLVRAMTCRDERKRPNAKMCLQHPYHWDSCKTIRYFKDVSDTIIGEQRNNNTNMANALDQNFHQVFQLEWETTLTLQVQIELFTAPRTRTRPRYNKFKVSSLIRAIRNTKDHFHEMVHLHQELGNDEIELLAYWTKLFPQLFIHAYTTLKPMANLYRNLQQYY
ncbi:serine/threonine-protein kinase/endoribonuclease IRE1-like [Mya arenaria]|uniref:serine/threonine-protein kinase/endoribonuclease IRE1-like n=1 Tax=Mya arenaria TaxID=6604 RepID=UPI0022E3215B|nr:serine/threonine-protein kinase/endoribonuclease IRE1-like [Mya arenaria]